MSSLSVSMTWLDEATPSQLAAAYTALGPLRLRYTPIKPTPRQEAFLRITGEEVFFGGAAGPGKSSAMLAAALQYVDVPGYAALILRRTYADLILPGALMEMASRWLAPTSARFVNAEHTWIFPSGARLVFGYCRNKADEQRYASAEFQFVGFDELTQFPENAYAFLSSRTRRPSESRGSSPDGLTIDRVPIRKRAASNPGGPGHEWVKTRFVDVTTRATDTRFIPARAIDNPHLDVERYIKTLEHLLPVQRERLLRGDWDVQDEGNLFAREDFNIIPTRPASNGPRVRVWDLAGTKPSESNTDPDWVVGTLMQRIAADRIAILDVQRFRVAPADVESRVFETAKADGNTTYIRIEQEPGSAGKILIDSWKRRLFGWNVAGLAMSGDKVTRAVGYASAVGQGKIDLVSGPWVLDWLNEHTVFPFGSHDDQVDTGSFGFNLLVATPPRGKASSAAAARIT
jgi:predicted phage terminase large subunit-like protein